METEYVLQDMPPSGTTHTDNVQIGGDKELQSEVGAKEPPKGLERLGLRTAESTAQGARKEHPRRRTQECWASKLQHSPHMQEQRKQSQSGGGDGGTGRERNASVRAKHDCPVGQLVSFIPVH